MLLLLAATTAGASLPRAQPGADAATYGATVHGNIESVRKVLLETLETGWGSLYEHAVGPSDQLVVRLDDGRAVTVLQNEAPRFEPGERVMVLSGARVEHAH